MEHGTIVFAGGGVAGIAWEVGVLQGIADADAELAARLLEPSTAFIGTSAGSAVAAQLGTGIALSAAYETQLADETADLGADVDRAALEQAYAEAIQGATSPQDARRRIGALALAAPAGDEDARRAVIAARLTDHRWPERDLRVTAVDTASGDLRVFDRDSDVPLVDAIAASCAVPGVWPPMTIDGARYMDGGVRSGSNADLAAGSPWVLIITPLPGVGAPGIGTIPTNELEALGSAAVEIVYADAASIAAFGPNSLDPSTRVASAQAGRALGATAAGRIRSLLAAAPAT
ncbi:patatin-like phospholipase family protein [Microbacteriaceae bacterium VKM Ac-2855]|nr:patatin-like phospholipase family protein [Microbacteriaceae bacterium VKM Ac-2855]